ncbi:fimbrial protein [Klebsiella pasteurii]|uniref:fimbrial protein n=1 Tax=Klebsiella pasteurii TaxID=2587529 RepID=UPI00115AE942|nr:fimbrial protein [Klebsiella pasteurii]VUS85472.1 hypothetical protein SB6416_05407 [Klebsiella pasteurii]VUS87107.1 hypothetical protein SB6424_05422 [Klebsiella pasteurii]
MKNKWLYIFLFILSGHAFCATQKFKFSGTLVKGSCSVKQKVEVSLGQIDISQMRNVGYSRDSPFNISFYDCDTLLSLAVSMRFTADTYSGFPNKIKPTTAPNDSKYAIGIYFNNKPLTLNADISNVFGYSEKLKSFDIPFVARLETIDSSEIFTGNVQGSLFFEVEYN